jgi:hydrogenase-4 component F
MIFLIYVLCGVLLLGITFAVMPRHTRNLGSALAKADVLNTLTLIHISAYVLITLYIINLTPLPLFAFKQYLFIDPLAIFEVLISVIVFFLAVLFGRGYIKSLMLQGEVKPESLELFYGSFNLLMIVIVFSFFSNNLALFWILLELTTILSAVLIVMLSARDNIIAALKYVFIASTAMLFSVAGIIMLFAITKQAAGTGTLNWNELMAGASSFPTTLFTFAFIFIFIGFASKAGIVPFHTWLPQAHARAPSMVSAVLSAVLLNGGIYGILRLFSIAHQTESWHTISIILIVFGTISIAIAALSMFPRSNIKKLIGFSSIEHMGLVLIGIGVGTPLALFWTLFHILGHSMIKSLLFFSAGILNRQYNSNRLQDIQNALKLQPLASWGTIIGSVAVIGMPPFPMFFSKLFILIQLSNFSIPALLIVLLFLLLVAGAFAFLIIKAFCRQSEITIEPYRVDWTLKLPIVLLLIIITGLSIFLPFGLSTLLINISSSLGF